MAKIINLKVLEDLDFNALQPGEFHRLHIHIPGSPLGTPWKVPVLIAKGKQPGPVLGITAAVHGNELNGLSSIFKLFKTIDPNKLKGTLVAVPISNVPGYLAN